MKEPENNEQWLLDGDCSQCRRKSYCSKPCKIAERETDISIRNAIMTATGLDKIEEVMLKSMWRR